MTTTLYIAPHPDDVALSCAGGVLTRTAAGERVVICTVFTRTRDRAIEQRRAAEDAAALSLAGAERIDLGFEDAPDREGIPPTFTALLLDAPVKATLVREVQAALAAVIKQLAPRDVWFPLGIGRHLDHRTVFAARGAVGSRARARFYEDRPYAFVPAFRRLRTLELAGGRPVQLTPAAILAQLDAHACAAFAAPSERDTVAARLATRLATPGARDEGLVLRARTIPYPLATLRPAAAMIAAYRSQTQALFGITDIDAIAGLWRRETSSARGWFEREVMVARRA